MSTKASNQPNRSLCSIVLWLSLTYEVGNCCHENSRYHCITTKEPFGRKKSNKNLVNGGGDENDANTAAKKQLDSLMEHTRLKNISICRRRLPDMPIPDLVRAINALDLKTLSVDTVEVLQRMVPLDQGGNSIENIKFEH